MHGWRRIGCGLAGLGVFAACGRQEPAASKPETPVPVAVGVSVEAGAKETGPTSPRSQKPTSTTAVSRRSQDLAALLAKSRVSEKEEDGAVRLAGFFKDWAGEDLSAARAAASELSDFSERLAAHEGLLAEALAKNPKAAVAWLRGLEPKAMAEVLLDAALADWAGVDAAGAAKYVVELGSSDYRTVLAGELARAWAAKDGPAAMAWGASLQDQEAREEALTEAVHVVAATDARAAAEMTLKIEHEAARTDTLELAVIAWWERDPAAVTAWAERIADAELRAQAQRLVRAQREAVGK